MTVELLHHTPLWVAAKAIRKCWASEGKSDTKFHEELEGEAIVTWVDIGEKDKELIHRVGNKNKHASTLEHLNYTFDIDGISRACLQELARHRHASMSVKSTRYTLKELRETPDDRLHEFLVHVTDDIEGDMNINALRKIKHVMNTAQAANDRVKYYLPEAYKTSLVWTVNARSLQNFLQLRTNKSALWEIRELAYEIARQLPKEHHYLFEEFLYKEGEQDGQS